MLQKFWITDQQLELLQNYWLDTSFTKESKSTNDRIDIQKSPSWDLIHWYNEKWEYTATNDIALTSDKNNIPSYNKVTIEERKWMLYIKREHISGNNTSEMYIPKEQDKSKLAPRINL